MDEKRKAELRGLCERATPSPWMLEPRTRTLCGKTRAVELLCGMNDEDAAFVCLSRTALPELLDDNDAKDKEIERLNAELAASESMANAAVADLEKNCTTCAHKGHSGLSFPCLNCQGTNYANWEWRGVQGVNTNG